LRRCTGTTLISGNAIDCARSAATWDMFRSSNSTNGRVVGTPVDCFVQRASTSCGVIAKIVERNWSSRAR
jgi:hypothetical protein